jgi:hypothetical protein
MVLVDVNFAMELVKQNIADLVNYQKNNAESVEDLEFAEVVKEKVNYNN